MANFWPQALRHRKYRTALGAIVIFSLIAFVFLGAPTFGPSTQNRIDVAPQACTTAVTPNNDILPFAACHINKKVPEKARLIFSVQLLTCTNLHICRRGLLNPSCMDSVDKMSCIQLENGFLPSSTQ